MNTMMTTNNMRQEVKEATERGASLRKEIAMLSAVLPNIRGQVIPARRVEARLAAAKDELATLTFWLGMVAESGIEELARLDCVAEGEQDVADLVNSKHPLRDFSANTQTGFRTVEDFDSTVMKGIACA